MSLQFYEHYYKETTAERTKYLKFGQVFLLVEVTLE